MMKRYIYSILIIITAFTACDEMGLLLGDNENVLVPVIADTTIRYIQITPSAADTNYSTSAYLEADRWTHSSQPSIQRSLIQFDLSAIPAGAEIAGAYISLYGANESINDHWHMNFTIMGSGYQPNDSYLQRITSSWDVSTVTYNTQPSTTTANQVSLSNSLTHGDNYIDIDITDCVKDMVTDPANSFGIMLVLQNEVQYSRISFASTDNADSAKHPRIVIYYTSSDE